MPIPTPNTLPGILSQIITTPRLTTRVLFSGDDDGIPVLFIHGNASSATFWEETMLALPEGYRAVAPDQRGYGGADPDAKIDATRGMGDLSDDAIALLDTLEIDKAHIVGHSLGGSVMWRMMIDHPSRFLSATFVAPGSPYGFGGTKDVHGTPHWDDFAGSGGGIVSPAFAKAISENERGDAQGTPRNIMNSFYFKPPFRSPREEDLLTSLNSEHVGDKEYPGDLVPSDNWPNVAPGVWGPANALSPKYAGDVSALFRIHPKPPVLWIRGADDQIVSDNSFFDLGVLGALGVVPGFPGADVYPPQPMVGQVRAVLDKYREAGGTYEEIVLADCGHTPFIEKPDEFNAALHSFIMTVQP